MRAFAVAGLVLAATFFATFALGAGVAIYGFDGYEAAWGKGGSLQVAWWMAFGASLLVLLGGGIGARLVGRQCATRAWIVAVAGVAFSLVSILFFWLLSVVEFEFSYILVIPWFLFVPMFVGYLVVWPVEGQHVSGRGHR